MESFRYVKEFTIVVALRPPLFAFFSFLHFRDSPTVSSALGLTLPGKLIRLCRGAAWDYSRLGQLWSLTLCAGAEVSKISEFGISLRHISRGGWRWVVFAHHVIPPPSSLFFWSFVRLYAYIVVGCYSSCSLRSLTYINLGFGGGDHCLFPASTKKGYAHSTLAARFCPENDLPHIEYERRVV